MTELVFINLAFFESTYLLRARFDAGSNPDPKVFYDPQWGSISLSSRLAECCVLLEITQRNQHRAATYESPCL